MTTVAHAPYPVQVLPAFYHTDSASDRSVGSPSSPPHQGFGQSGESTFRQQIIQQCLTESAIDPELFEAAIALHRDLELDGSGEPSTPIHDALNWHYSRFGNQARASFEAALFLDESGATWQAKVSFNPKDGKGYFAPTGAGSKPYLPPVPPAIRQRIAARYGCDVPLEGCFWDWVASHPELEIIYTEGVKKALSLLSQGYIAISLYGIYGGYRSKDAIGAPITPALIPELDRFCHSDRPVALAFDQDSAAKTRRKVTATLFKFGWLLTRAGCSVRLALWNGALGKGIDDLIGNVGPGAAQAAISEALSLDEYRLKLALDNCLGGLTPALRLNTQDLSTLKGTAIPQSGIVAISSAKGTGKTKMVAGLVGGGDAALLLGHRIALIRNLCARLGINYRGDLDKAQGRYTDGDAYTLRVGGCGDGTLLAINPSDFEGCDLILDEVVQFLRHLFTSPTCNKDGARPVLLARFTEVVRAARRVILADADLNKDVIGYIASLRGDGAPAWLLVNDAKVEPWPVDFLEAPDASAITAQLLDDVADGKRVFVATDSKAGAKRLNQMIANIEGTGGKVLLLSSETSGGEIEQAYIKTPDSNLSHTVVIATPSMGTGVSIETQGAYDAVYGIFWGASSTDADMAQALARVRQPVPRVIWCAKHGRNFSKVGRDTSPQRLKKLLQEKANATAQLTAASLGALGAEVTGYDWSNPHVDLWAKIEADRNRSMLSLRSALKVRLIHEGHNLTIQQLGTDAATREQMAAVRLQIKEAGAEAIANAVSLTLEEVQSLEKAEATSPDERLALQKWHLADFYAVTLDEVTADLVLLDNDGRYRGQLRELEAFLHPEVASSTDARSIEKQAQHNLGICPWDVGTAELRRQVRVRLGVGQWIGSDREWISSDDDLIAFASTALDMAPQVKAAINVALKPDMSPQQILGQLLDQMGIETKSRQFRAAGKVRRAYSIDQASKAMALDILTRRAQRRNPAPCSESAPVTPPPISLLIPGGCDTPKTPTGRDWAELAEMVGWAKRAGAAALADLRDALIPQVGADTWAALEVA